MASFSSTLAPNSAQTTAEQPAALSMVTVLVVAMWAILAVGLCNSIMFPTVFSMAMHQLGGATGQISGLLCMAIFGGAIVTFAQRYLADLAGVQWSFLLPALCYLPIIYFGVKYVGMYCAGTSSRREIASAESSEEQRN